jgi:hypothetical protein
VSWNIFDLLVWAQVELQLGIMCASAPSLRVFFRRYLGNSASSRAFKSGGRATPALGNTLNSSVGPDKPDKTITVVRSTSVTVNDQIQNDMNANRKPWEESLDTVGESLEEGRGWSPTPSKERLTRDSHEEPIALQDMNYKLPGRSRWSGKF